MFSKLNHYRISTFTYNPHGILFIIILVSLVLFSPIFSVFLSADDFFNIRLILGSTWQNIVSVFMFGRNENFLFYRPLTTQFYYFLLYPLFGLHSLGYHVVSYIVFIAIILLVYKLSIQLTKNKITALYATFFYALSSSNLTRLAWSVQIQELGFGFFVFCCMISWIYFLQKKQSAFFLYSILFFIFSLMSKETAVVVPALLGIVTIAVVKPLKNTVKQILPLLSFFILLIPYLYLRFVTMGVSTGDHYFTIFSLKSIINTILWFVLWAIGLPEELVNLQIFASGLHINPAMVDLIQTQMPWVGIGFILFTSLVGISLVVHLIGFKIRPFRLSDTFKLVVVSVCWFVLSLIPHLFSPFHKFAYSLTVPLFGISLILATTTSLLLSKDKSIWKKLIVGGIITSYFFLSWSTIQVEKNLHWVFLRSTMVHRVYDYMNNNSTMMKAQKITSIAFVNDKSPINNPYGVSNQLSVALSDDAFMQLYFNDRSFKTYYEDTEKIPSRSSGLFVLPSSQFIK